MGDHSMSFNFIEYENDDDDIDVFDKLYQLFAPAVDVAPTTDGNCDDMLSSDTHIVERNLDQQKVDHNGLFYRNNNLVTTIQTQYMHPISTDKISLEFVAESTTVWNTWKVDQDWARQVSPLDSNFLSQKSFTISGDLDRNCSNLIQKSTFDEESLPEDNVSGSLRQQPDNISNHAVQAEDHSFVSYVPYEISCSCIQGPLGTFQSPTGRKAQVGESDEVFFQTKSDPEDNGIFANLGLEAYLKSVESEGTKNPKKRKLMKIDGPLPPLRPLSAYNYFFRDERERILQNGEEWNAPVPRSFYSKERQVASLQEHWNQDRTIRRRHRKTHGQVSFSKLSKLVSQRWQELPEEGKTYYKEMSAKDWERYRKDVDESKLKKQNDVA
jgi:HMG (high mobility group) box